LLSIKGHEFDVGVRKGEEERCIITVVGLGGGNLELDLKKVIIKLKRG